MLDRFGGPEGLLGALEQFQAAMAEIDAAIAGVIETFDALNRRIEDAVGRAYEQVLLTNASPEETYDYFANKAKTEFASLSEAQTPEDIGRIVDSTISSIMSAWATLTPEQQAELQPDFLTMLETVQAAGLERSDEAI